jgi:glutamyl/glutaminyl-tRNA synthetase
MPSPRSERLNSDELDFESALQAIEQDLQTLKARYIQVQADQQRQQNLQQQLGQTEQALRRHRSSKVLQTELKQIRQQLEELEVALESQLFSWSGLREVFWQAVRFGGIGVVIGWVLKSCASGN